MPNKTPRRIIADRVCTWAMLGGMALGVFSEGPLRVAGIVVAVVSVVWFATKGMYLED